ncbi:hypothetical protein [Pseudomonas oryzae]|uniref:Uncharacterized protein n=1 Tax=Pseudomonas oryzae TaxID=1392877 RepID=A0A1H1SNR0_9PSED|nr:hypothetical protein [Pseudomonas oryzae]SDS49366.1 hypothetical protein SAMN05216221_1943 [Pseudomonas oryzae]
MTIRTLKQSQGYTGQAQDELEVITDGAIVVSYNTVRADGDVCWRRYDQEDDWHDLPYTSAELPASHERIIEFVRDYLDLNEED